MSVLSPVVLNAQVSDTTGDTIENKCSQNKNERYATDH
jgi:hypothetical protein